MSNHTTISFGDNVRVRDTVETRKVGLAGEVGSVYGETTPSATGVEVIGETPDDWAINVHFEGRDDSLWFAPQLLVFIDHGPGTEIRIDGVDKKWVRDESGQWIEESTAKSKKRWWKWW